ncbi:MAG: hypothetical protein WCL14_06755 [Bacteroidota bacterium]
MKEEDQRLWNAIDEILWNDWDPIGINDIAPRNEYSSYTPIIYDLVINGADKETIAIALDEIVTKRMVLISNIEYNRRIAELIINI